MNTQTSKLNTNKLLLTFSAFLFVFLNAFGVSATNRNPVADFDGDGKTDISVYRPSNSYWYISKSSGGYSFFQWGLSGDKPVPGDYDGDGKTDLAVYRYNTRCIWYILRSSDNNLTTILLGKNEFLGIDTPLPADYDGDGKTDAGVFLGSDFLGQPGGFSIIQSSTGSNVVQRWGLNTDRTIQADYDGDGKADYAILRDNIWYILQSSNNTIRIEYFGSNDYAMPADYDGDGKTDIAVWRPSNGYWYWLSSRDGSFNSYQFGMSEDKPVPGDYDGDGKTDFAVFRPSTGTWYLQQSTRGFRAEQFGLSTDVPIPYLFHN